MEMEEDYIYIYKVRQMKMEEDYIFIKKKGGYDSQASSTICEQLVQ